MANLHDTDLLAVGRGAATYKATFKDIKDNLPAVPDASETAKGVVELATAAETTTGTDSTRAVHPAGLKVELDKKAPLASPTFTGVPAAPTAAAGTKTTQLATTAFVDAAITAIPAQPDASETVKGIAELATQAEVTAGTDDARIVTPLKLKTELDKKVENFWKRTGTELSPVNAGDTVQISAGTTALPALTPVGDPNTGVLFPSGDQLAISTNGTRRLLIDTNGSVGIGTSTPQSILAIRGNTPRITLEPLNDTSQNCRIQFASKDGTVQSRLTGGGSDGNELRFSQGSTERFRLDSSGRLLVGVSSGADLDGAANASFATKGPTTNGGIAITHYDHVASSDPVLALRRSASNLIGNYEAIGTNHRHGTIGFYGTNGTGFAEGAQIRAESEGTWVVGDNPSRLVFSTTAVGSDTPTERMRIKNDGTINFSYVSVYADNAAAKAGGLVDGDVYRTSTGDLKIVYT